MKKLEKCRDIIYAGAIGDAFGYFIEFDTIEFIKYKYGDFITVNGMKVLKPEWRISDDTQMTLFCLDAIQHDIIVPLRHSEAICHDIFNNYTDWYKTQFGVQLVPRFSQLASYDSLCVREAPGNTCLTSLASGEAGSIESPINDSKGCGGIMRAAPIGFTNLPYGDIFRLGADQAALTHGHPCGYISAGIFSLLIRWGIDGHTVCSQPTLLFGTTVVIDGKFVRDIIKSFYKGYRGQDEMDVYMDKVYAAIDNTDVLLHGHSLTDALGQGWVGEEALGIAMYCALRYNTFSEVIEAGANHDGDSDSTASLAGQLFIAMGGELDVSYDEIPLTGKDAIDWQIKKLMENKTKDKHPA